MTILESEKQTATTPSTRRAEAALLFATLVWGSSFTWAKASGDAVNQITGAGSGALVGPTMLMALRFGLAGLLWLAVFPKSRRGWSLASVKRGLILGSLMSSGLVLQVIGLDRTSEAVSAFLTCLTILWVPALMTLWLGKPPRGIFWLGVGMAAGGVWMMTGAMPAGFGTGEFLGLACSIVFSVHIILVNLLIPKDDPWRMSAAQLVFTGLCALAICMLFPGGRRAWLPANILQVVVHPQVWLNLVLLIIFPTVISFGIQSIFQPRVDPTRATLIYLLEPIFAAGYAWLTIGAGLAKPN